VSNTTVEERKNDQKRSMLSGLNFQEIHMVRASAALPAKVWRCSLTLSNPR